MTVILRAKDSLLPQRNKPPNPLLSRAAWKLLPSFWKSWVASCSPCTFDSSSGGTLIDFFGIWRRFIPIETVKSRFSQSPVRSRKKAATDHWPTRLNLRPHQRHIAFGQTDSVVLHYQVFYISCERGPAAVYPAAVWRSFKAVKQSPFTQVRSRASLDFTSNEHLVIQRRTSGQRLMQRI